MGVDFPDYITSKGFVPISNQILGNSLLVIGYKWFNWESFFMFLSGSVALHMKVLSVNYPLVTNDYQYVQYAWYQELIRSWWYSMKLFVHTWIS